MPAAEFNKFDIEKGADFNPVLTLKNNDGTIFNLTGYTAAMKVKTAIGGTTILDLSTGGGEIVLGGVAGTVTFAVLAATTVAITEKGKGVYDLEIISAGSIVKKLIRGSVELIEEVTD